MNSPEIDKRELHQLCVANVQQHIDELEKEIKSIQESKFNETKSTAGDKYETTRAMMQAEEDRLKLRMNVACQNLNRLMQLDLESNTAQAAPGKLIITDQYAYFLSIALGNLMINQHPVYCVSIESPIGKALLGASQGDQIEFNNQTLKIKKIL